MQVRGILTVLAFGVLALLLAVNRSNSEAPADSAAEAVQSPKAKPGPAEPRDRRWVVDDGSVFAVWPEKERDLAVRRKLRAFLGAPPVIPHKLEKLNLCGNCHDVGSSLREGVAHMRPHDNLVNCTQCHVEAVNKRFGDVTDPPSTFVGQPEPLGGPRAFIGAPPVIPHPTGMRSRCLSCHGPFGLPAIRTPHPERSNCRQCHLTIDEVDRKP